MARLALLTPLRHRDVRLLWAGMTVSLLGDGIYLVATAWQVYALSDSPTALSLVGLAWSLGLVACLLLGGVAADRVDRRRIMIGADLLRALAVGTMGLLAVTGVLEVWHLALLAFLYGCGEGFFSPAFMALIPQLVPAPDLVAANALQETVQQTALRLAGPALGGLLVAATSPGAAYLIDAASFAIGIACVAAIAPRPLPPRTAVRRVRDELGEGLAYVRTQPWLWATLLAAAFSVLAFVGPVEVLLPYVIRTDLDGGSATFGLVLAVAGLGAVTGSVVAAQRGLPRRAVRLMYLAWGFGTLPLAGYAAATAAWQLAVLAFAYGAAMSVGTVVWSTLMQRRVPPALMGRVTSVDWLVSLGLAPVSFALTGPLAALVGADAVLVGAGVGACVATLAVYALVRPLRDDVLEEAAQVVGEARVGDGGGLPADDLDALLRR